MLAALQLLVGAEDQVLAGLAPAAGWDPSVYPWVAVQPEAQGTARQCIRAVSPMRQPAHTSLSDPWHGTHGPQLGWFACWGQQEERVGFWKESGEDGEAGKEKKCLSESQAVPLKSNQDLTPKPFPLETNA